jgi:PGF-CTERM protein
MAIEDFNKAIELDPNNAGAYSNRGVAYDDLKQYERAVEDHNKAIKLNPNCAVAYANRGAAYDHLKQYEKAIEDYNKAIELDPDFALVYEYRELAQSKLNGQQDVPGFEVEFTIVGLLAVAYLLIRRK